MHFDVQTIKVGCQGQLQIGGASQGVDSISRSVTIWLMEHLVDSHLLHVPRVALDTNLL